MNKKTSFNALKVTVGAALLTSTLGASMSTLAENPFVANDLGSGYQLASRDAEGKCGEGRCGGDSAKDAEGKCGEGKCGGGAEKDAEGKCGEGKCGGEAEKDAEGKCGEGRCGG